MKKISKSFIGTIPALAIGLVCLGAASFGAQNAPPPRQGSGAPAQQAAPSQQPSVASQAGNSAGSAAPGQSSQAPAPEQKKTPRAKSQDELDAYQKFMHEQNPDEQIKLIEDFLLAYPNTELKEYAYQAATQAYQAKNDFSKVLTYGELTLNENENNLVALLVLASSIPERTSKSDLDKETKLTQAEQYARRGLEMIAKLSMPPNLTEDQWAQIRKDAESTPHAALGMIALIREDFSKAEAEFKQSIDLASRPDPVTFYRMGLCYSFEKKFDLAADSFAKAASAGGVKVQGPDGATRDLVAEAKDFVVKAKAASETPVSGVASQPVPAPASARP